MGAGHERALDGQPAWLVLEARKRVKRRGSGRGGGPGPRLLLQPPGFEGFGVIPDVLVSEDPALAHRVDGRELDIRLRTAAYATPDNPEDNSIADIDEVADRLQAVGAPGIADLLKPAHDRVPTDERSRLRPI